MPPIIKTISTEAMKIAVNCYVVQSEVHGFAGESFFLIDTGMAMKQDQLVQELEHAGCRPGNLKLIILTHGDLDHSGNAASLRQRFNVKIAMHRADLVNVESGDMFANKDTNPIAKAIARLLFFVTGMGKFKTFTPDIFLEEGQKLTDFGWDATVLHLPGHSKGSIGILTPQGDLFCGDLLDNTRSPAVNAMGDNVEQMRVSAEKLKGFTINTVYPGHGKPFLLAQIWKE